MALSLTLVVPIVSLVFAHPILTFVLTPLTILLIRCLYRISPFHKLHSVPGPAYAHLSSLWLAYHAYVGDECSAVHKLHERYGPIVRTGPNSVDIADGSALHQIYVEKGGFLKPDFYSNFDIDGHRSIFSELEPRRRAERARAVMPLFSTSNLRAGGDVIGEAIDGFIARLERDVERAKREQGRFDLLVSCRALAIDVVTGYLFGQKYGGCEEDIDIGKKGADAARGQNISVVHDMTASAMVDAFVAVGKFWYFSPRWFQLMERINLYVSPDKAADESIQLVDEFVSNIVSQVVTSVDKDNTSYPARLLNSGFSKSEVTAQCKDLIFAGTDSTGMNLSTICFFLVKHPQIYQTLRTEIKSEQPGNDELQSMPYLRGVVREGLRLSMANPSRLPRVVPRGGWTFRDYRFPEGAVVSCTPYELHLDPLIFPDPYEFLPERWLAKNDPTEEMSRDHIAFGLGSRQCIARNLATLELFHAVKRIAEEDLLSGLRCVDERIEVLEWFNSHVVGGKIELTVDAA